MEVDRFGGGSVLDRGGITHDAKVRLVMLRETKNARRYVAILEPEAILFHRRLRNHTILMQDNARPHIAIATKDILSYNAVNLLLWP